MAAINYHVFSYLNVRSHIEHPKWCEYLYVCDTRDFNDTICVIIIHVVLQPFWISKWPPSIIMCNFHMYLDFWIPSKTKMVPIHLFVTLKISMIPIAIILIHVVRPPFWISKWPPSIIMCNFHMYLDFWIPSKTKMVPIHLFVTLKISMIPIAIILIHVVRPPFWISKWPSSIIFSYVHLDLLVP